MRKLTDKQLEILDKIKNEWDNEGKGLNIKKKNSLVINNLRRMGLVEIYPSHYPMKGFYQSWEAFPCEGMR